ncbi:hypothetical protein GIB67_001764 [Kingdonia uniflora]|uniref:DNA-3-methyladenine glycosylase I n=1 Tax=Kingdonia uniflora TaxID=39325 RepID=A0A7J7LBM8_9MAGN|nr:hypothetical protein GIB67_001764 [Kingdonia uniflora]
MSKLKVRKNVLQRKQNLLKEKEKQGQNFISKHLKKVYPLGIQKSPSSQSLPSLSLSQNSNDSSLSGSLSRSVRKKIIAVSPHENVAPPNGKSTATVNAEQNNPDHGAGGLKRCHWITKNSDNAYVLFHDEQWGVPVYDDNGLFELLALSSMLMYHFWIDILKRKELYRDVFARFDPIVVAKMSEKEIKDIISNKTLELAENQVRCVVDNAKSILKVVKEFGSFSNYLWGYMNDEPMINIYRYPQSVPLRTPKAESISKDLIRRGFRFVGPVIVYSFMQVAGMTMDHLVDCFRFTECVLALQTRDYRDNDS